MYPTSGLPSVARILIYRNFYIRHKKKRAHGSSSFTVPTTKLFYKSNIKLIKTETRGKNKYILRWTHTWTFNVNLSYKKHGDLKSTSQYSVDCPCDIFMSPLLIFLFFTFMPEKTELVVKLTSGESIHISDPKNYDFNTNISFLKV